MQSYDARLMSGRLPVLIDPIRLADEGVRLQGELAGGDMARLRVLTAPDSRPAVVTVDLQFERSVPGVRRMHGRIHTTVEMVCQRCLNKMVMQIVALPKLTLLQPGETAHAEDEDALPLEATVTLSELVEDELLLAMPMIPVHAESDCTAVAKPGAAPLPIAGHKENPFAVLHGLKNKHK